MAKDVAKSRADKLAALREKLSHVDVSRGAKGFLRLSDGRNIIRILPAVGEMEFFFQEVGKHNLPPDGKKSFYCPKFTSGGNLECPICDYVDELYKSGDKVNKELASKLRVRRMFWMNAVDRGNAKAGPQVYTPGVTVFGTIASLIGDPDYGDIFDPTDGTDLIIEKSGKELDTEYQVKPKRTSTPLSDDEDEMKKWLKDAKDLSFVEVSDDPEEDAELSKGHAVFVLPYERLEKEFSSVADSDEDEDEDEDDEPRPAKRKAVSKRKDEDEDDEEETPAPRKLVSKGRKVPAKVEPEDDDEDSDEESEDDEDDEDEVKVKGKSKSSKVEDEDDEDEEKDDDDDEEEVEKELTSRRMARRRPR
jgi:hypothetical protein